MTDPIDDPDKTIAIPGKSRVKDIANSETLDNIVVSPAEPASLKQRALAGLIDAILIIVVILACKFGWDFLRPDASENPLPFAFGLGISLLYLVFMHFNDGQTIGKKVAKTRVVSASEIGLPSFAQIAGRQTAGLLVSLLPLGFGYFGVIKSADKRALHDRLFKTRVISTRL